MTTQSVPAIFNFQQSPITVFLTDGDPWFIASEILAVLGLHRTAVRRLDDDEKGVRKTHTLGGEQEVATISEPGLYRLIGRSNKPAAKTFNRWVCHEVLPAIRKTGHYEATPSPKTKKALPGCLTLEQQDTIKAMVKQRVETCPKDKQAKAAITCWSAIKSKFGVSYKAVPAEHYTEVLSLVARLPLEGEHLPVATTTPGQSSLSDALRQAITRKAHGLTLESFDAVRDALTAQVESWVVIGLPEPELLERLHDHRHDLVLIHAADLWGLTATFAGFRGFVDDAMNIVHHLEKSTGRQWYGRGKRARP